MTMGNNMKTTMKIEKMKDALLTASRDNKDTGFGDLYLNLTNACLADNPKIKHEFSEISNSWDKKIGDFRISLYEDFITNLKDEHVEKIYNFIISEGYFLNKVI